MDADELHLQQTAFVRQKSTEILEMTNMDFGQAAGDGDHGSEVEAVAKQTSPLRSAVSATSSGSSSKKKKKQKKEASKKKKAPSNSPTPVTSSSSNKSGSDVDYETAAAVQHTSLDEQTTLRLTKQKSNVMMSTDQLLSMTGGGSVTTMRSSGAQSDAGSVDIADAESSTTKKKKKRNSTKKAQKLAKASNPRAASSTTTKNSKARDLRSKSRRVEDFDTQDSGDSPEPPQIRRSVTLPGALRVEGIGSSSINPIDLSSTNSGATGSSAAAAAPPALSRQDANNYLASIAAAGVVHAEVRAASKTANDVDSSFPPTLDDKHATVAANTATATATATQDVAVRAIAVTRDYLEEEVRQRLMSEVATAEVVTTNPAGNSHAFSAVESARALDSNNNNEERDESRNSKSNNQKRKKWILLALLLLAIVVGGIVGVVVATSSSDDPDESELKPDQKRLFDLLRERAPAVMEPSTPQGKAFGWMVRNRRTADDPDAFDTFALVTLYYSTQGQSWTNSENWLSDDVSICLWYPGNLCGDEQDGVRRQRRRVLQEEKETRVIQLDLSNNNLVGSPEEIGLLEHLQELRLAGNDLNGASLLRSLFRLSTLRILDLSANPKMEGTFPNDLSAATNLQELYLDSNALLSGTIPTFIGLLQSLQVFSAQDVGWTGTIPTELGNLQELQVLDMKRTVGLDGAIPDALWNLPRLRYLDLTGLKLDGQLPQMTQVPWEYFILHENRLTGTVPTEIGLWKSLVTLDLARNSLRGTVPKELGTLNKLKHLSLQRNILSGSLPSEMAQLSALESFDADSNKLSGEIFTEIGSLGNLQNLTLRDNLLSGKIPSEIGLLSNLLSLKISNNPLQGSIPPELGRASNLLEIFFGDNQLTGSLPVSMAQMSNLKFLRLENNDFVSTLPMEFKAWTQLVTFDVSHNRLEGDIPKAYGAMTSLERIHLESNLLKGKILPNFCKNVKVVAKTTSIEFYADCPDEIWCLCCTFCCSEGSGCTATEKTRSLLRSKV